MPITTHAETLPGQPATLAGKNALEHVALSKGRLMQYRPGQHALQQVVGTCDRELQSDLHLPLLQQDFSVFWRSLPDDL